MRKLRQVGAGENDPLDGVANFFDLGVIFALGFMVPLMLRPNAAEQSATPSPDGTAASVPAPAESQRVRLDRYHPSSDTLHGEGERLGVAYRLKNGEVVYVPEVTPQK